MSDQRDPGRPPVERVIGCLLGLAVGDALGMPLLDLSAVDIEDQYGAVDGFVEPPAGSGRPIDLLELGMYTADTQLALLVAGRLAEAGAIDAAAFAADLAAWVKRHDERLRLARAAERSVLFAGRMLYRGDLQEVPTTLDDNGSLAVGVVAGLARAGQPERGVELARELVGVVTASAVVLAAAAALADGVAQCAAWSGPFEPAAFLRGIASRAAALSPDLAQRIDLAAELLAAPARRAQAELGGGHGALETLPAALHWFARSSGEPRAAITSAVGAGGDTSTVGALCGALSGCLNGADRLPPDWIRGLRDGLEDGVDDYFGARSAGADDIRDLAERLAARLGELAASGS